MLRALIDSTAPTGRAGYRLSSEARLIWSSARFPVLTVHYANRAVAREQTKSPSRTHCTTYGTYQHHRGPVQMYCTPSAVLTAHAPSCQYLHCTSRLLFASLRSLPFGGYLPPAAQQWTWHEKKGTSQLVLLSAEQVLRPQKVSESRRTRRPRYRRYSHRWEAGWRERAGRASAQLLFYHPGRAPGQTNRIPPSPDAPHLPGTRRRWAATVEWNRKNKLHDLTTANEMARMTRPRAG
jgi:hypothetical protein